MLLRLSSWRLLFVLLQSLVGSCTVKEIDLIVFLGLLGKLHFTALCGGLSDCTVLVGLGKTNVYDLDFAVFEIITIAGVSDRVGCELVLFCHCIFVRLSFTFGLEAKCLPHHYGVLWLLCWRLLRLHGGFRILRL